MSHLATFLTTRWSLVLSTRGRSEEAKRALDELCVTYWFPLFAHARQVGQGDADATETVQGFIAQLLEGGKLDGAEPSGGRFRAYLLGALQNYMSNERRAARAVKRDGGRVESLENPNLPIEVAEAASRYSGARLATLSPEEAFDRTWAEELIAAATTRLRNEYEERGKGLVFDALEDTLDDG